MIEIRVIYYALAVIGAVIPYGQFVPWLQEAGPDAALFISQLAANRISLFFAFDLLITAMVVLVFVVVDGRRRGVRHLWLPIIVCLTIGVSCALPLYLGMREPQVYGD